MAEPCSTGGRPQRRLARRLSTAAASLLPGAVLVLLPKCPLCLAAWLTLATGFSLTAAGAVRVRGIVVVFWVAAVAIAAASMIRRVAERRGKSGDVGAHRPQNGRLLRSR